MNHQELGKLIPHSLCRTVYVGTGNTSHSVQEMVNVIRKNLNQGAVLAPKLKGGNLKETVANVHSFLNANIRYKADGEDQMLRSLSCSWKERYTGVDCKSFSIAASTILMNLGIDHAIRRIKQPSFAPDQYTHVYVIVYKNHEKRDYYVLDATLKNNIEPKFHKKHDTVMSLKHYALNQAHGMGFSWNDIKNNIPKDDQNITSNQFLTKIGSYLQGIFGNLFDDGWYKRVHVQQNHTKMMNHFLNEVQKINNVKENPALLAKQVAETLCQTRLFHETFTRKRSDPKWANSTRRNLDQTIKAADFFKSYVSEALVAWCNKHYNITTTSLSVQCSSAGYEEQKGFFGMYMGNLPTILTQTYIGNFSRKNPSQPIENFVINDTLYKQFENGQKNMNSYLESISSVFQSAGEVIGQVEEIKNNFGGGSTPLPNAGNVGYQAPTQTTQAGFGAVTILMGLVAGGLLINQISKNK
jgi:hypothetical protein